MTEYFVGWGGLALINAALANLDGRSPLKYFLGSLVLGAVAPGTPDPDRQLDVTVRTADRTWLRTRIPLASLGFGLVVPLPEPLPLPPKQLEVELHLPDDAPPVILAKVLLLETGAPVPPGSAAGGD